MVFCVDSTIFCLSAVISAAAVMSRPDMLASCIAVEVAPSKTKMVSPVARSRSRTCWRKRRQWLNTDILSEGFLHWWNHNVAGGYIKLTCSRQTDLHAAYRPTCNKQTYMQQTDLHAVDRLTCSRQTYMQLTDLHAADLYAADKLTCSKTDLHAADRLTCSKKTYMQQTDLHAAKQTYMQQTDLHVADKT